MEQTEPDDDTDEKEVAGRPVSIAVHKQDGSDGQEFHLQVDRESLQDKDDNDIVRSSTTLQVNTDPAIVSKVFIVCHVSH